MFFGSNFCKDRTNTNRKPICNEPCQSKSYEVAVTKKQQGQRGKVKIVRYKQRNLFKTEPFWCRCSFTNTFKLVEFNYFSYLNRTHLNTTIRNVLCFGQPCMYYVLYVFVRIMYDHFGVSPQNRLQRFPKRFHRKDALHYEDKMKFYTQKTSNTDKVTPVTWLDHHPAVQFCEVVSYQITAVAFHPFRALKVHLYDYHSQIVPRWIVTVINTYK